MIIIPDLPSEAIHLAAEIVARYRPGDPVTPAVMLAHAIDYAANGWPVFPLRGKAPAAVNPHPRGSQERLHCKGECGRDGHGLYDATTDLDVVYRRFALERPGANIGLRPPEQVFVLDSDPRAPNHIEAAAKLRDEYGPLPATLTTVSGRLDGGIHRFYRRPPGKLKARLGVKDDGLDIKDHRGYVVAPPSIHPDTGMAYVAVDHPVEDPDWLVDLIVEKPKPVSVGAGRQFRGRPSIDGKSPADHFTDSASWSDILMPHGWACRSPDPDADGAVWLHPDHTSQCSATVRHGCLFVWSTNTPFEPTSPGDPHGYTRFRAYAVLDYGGDLSAAARSLLRKAS